MAERGSRMSTVMKLATGSILLGLLVLALKTLAWRLTGSVALMSDALESIVNVATAVAALVAIRVAQRRRMTATPMATTRPSSSRPCWKAC